MRNVVGPTLETEFEVLGHLLLELPLSEHGVPVTLMFVKKMLMIPVSQDASAIVIETT